LVGLAFRFFLTNWFNVGMCRAFLAANQTDKFQWDKFQSESGIAVVN
jgi:hypothetical protein